MERDIVQYCNCMEQVKLRLAVIDSIVKGQSPLKREDFDGEIVCLHLRKILELIAFASLCAHKNAYAQAHADFAKHWSAKRLIKKLKRIHPDFYPQPVKMSEPVVANTKHFEPLADSYLTLDDFEFLYDACSKGIHIRNPFNSDGPIINFERPISE